MAKIVVTGVGIITSLGAGKEANLQKLKAGERAIGQTRYLQTVHCDIPVGEVPYSDGELKQMLELCENEMITRTSLLGRVALREALKDARLSGNDGGRMAFISGNTVGGMEKTEQFYPDFLHSDARNDYIPLHDCGAGTEAIAQEYDGHFQLVTTISTACSSAANAVVMGANLIRDGRTDIAVVGGTECLSKFHLNGFHSLMILDKQCCRPFDADRNGLNLGEGAAYLVLESEACARKRNAKVLCELSGYGNACDAFHQTATSPNGDGAYLAMKKALAMSGLQPEDISYVNAHGTGTGNNDECEGNAMMRIFGDRMPPVSSTKGYTGHTTSAAGGVESVFSILSLLHGFIPANLGYEHPIAQHNFQPVTKVIENVQLRHVLTNSFGFGGNDSSCIFSQMGTSNGFEGRAKFPVYIQNAAHISMQQPLDQQWFENPLSAKRAFNETLDPDYKPYFAPMVSRRMGKLLKRAVVTAVNALADNGLPDAIITGTGLGCIDNTEKFLQAMIENGETLLQPTFFMQSTHNTISSQVAQYLHCHGYNSTYSHRGLSFDCALLDGFLQLHSGEIRSALVGAHDEMTQTCFNLLGKIGYWKEGDMTDECLRASRTNGSLAGSCSVNLLLSTECDDRTMCAVSGVEVLHRPTKDELHSAAQQLLRTAGLTRYDLSAVVSSLSGDRSNDLICNEFIEDNFPELPVVWYKHLFGVSFSASAAGVYVGAVCLQRQLVPAHLLRNREKPVKDPCNILIHNHFKNIDHSLTLLTIC